MNTDDTRTVDILLAEDNPGDIKLTRKALQKGGLTNEVTVVEDGVEALSYLRDDGEPRPDLILLDLNMPRKDGREVLKEIKTDEALRRIPVVVLTSSEAEEDILKSYELHANAYLTKPVDFEGFLEVVDTLEEFWLEIVRLPPE
jgi:chemotaxis family two-component system response regulator Rcp1